MTWSQLSKNTFWHSFICLFDYDQQNCINDIEVVKILYKLKERKQKYSIAL